MKYHSLLLCLLGFSSLGFTATGQYPCKDTVYYARSLGGERELLLCQTTESALTILYGPIKEYTPEIDVRFHEADLQVTTRAGRCEITLPLPPYHLVLSMSFEQPVDKDTLVFSHPTQEKTQILLDNTTRIHYLNTLRVVKERCEKI